MSQRLNRLFEKKRKAGKKLISVFVTAGFPEKKDTVDILLSLEKAGVDFVELGIPFSDPIADGPVIQAASDRALKNGVQLPDVFQMVQNVRRVSSIPVILMGYLNPLFHFGIEKAIEISQESEVDGWIIPDWPLEESESFLPYLQEKDIDLIHLIAPNTPMSRIRAIDDLSTTFIYCVSYTGVTGRDHHPTPELINFLIHLRKEISHPLMIGFGIKNRQDYLTYTRFCDGVIIGSAFIKLLQKIPPVEYHTQIVKFIRQLRR